MVVLLWFSFTFRRPSVLCFASWLSVVRQVKTVNSQSRYEALSSLLRGLDGSAIVYVMTKKDAEQLAVDVRDFCSAGVAMCNNI